VLISQKKQRIKCDETFSEKKKTDPAPQPPPLALQVCQPRTEVLIAYKQRIKCDEAFFEAAARHFDISVVWRESEHSLSTSRKERDTHTYGLESAARGGGGGDGWRCSVAVAGARAAADSFRRCGVCVSAPVGSE